ncbi:uncharacterized protein I303_101769 [Kwoniella dejecticola CBS 10117]|uniref:RNA polymerase II elongation factor ELL N-terminal domain-containing protein n=1 Tax=Kwoniella dejecticola CBS 10117 TaxID=1296121 RepID=A0A1A6ACU9_9TREE|nr:uncharacterized protein I303_02095 [Kwoniella dejecticola CBS 10117]OBR87881.1 hypothetical protein I303_02095 [Kwoniella dejecticola CBS 10117]
MPLPTSGQIPLVPPDAGNHSNPAYLIKFPEEVWTSLQDAGNGGLEVTMTVDGKMTLNIPNLPPIPLDPRPTGIPSEIHSYSASSSSLTLNAMANTRLNVPLTSVSTARAADKLKAQNEAFERERKERAVKVDGTGQQPTKKRSLEKSAPGISSAGMGRTISSPQMSTTTSLPTAAASSTGSGSTPMIPLKTRVMQLLALGPTTVLDIVRRVGGDEHNVMNVVKAIGRASTSLPPTYTLLPNQYAKIKLGPGQWKYTYAEQQQVIRLARAAFDELELPFDAEEREELDRKEAEMENAGGYHSTASSSGSASGSGSGSRASQEKSTAAAVPQNGLAISPPVPANGVHAQKRSESSAPATSISTKTKPSNGNGTTSTSKKTGPQSKIARERAKFMAEKQRSSSLPNTKPVDGTASPRSSLTEVKHTTTTTSSRDRGSPKKRSDKVLPLGQEDGKSKGKGKAKGKEIDYSSDDDESEEEEPLRGRPVNGKPVNGTGGKEDVPQKVRDRDKDRPSLAEKVREREKAKAKELELERTRKKRTYSATSASAHEEEEEGQVKDTNTNADEEEGEIRGRPKAPKLRRNSSPGSAAASASVKAGGRKGPPPELKLESMSSTNQKGQKDTKDYTSTQPASAPLPTFRKSGSGSGSSRSTSSTGHGNEAVPEPDQEALRDRYEELYPAYQQLTKKLTKFHQAAENGLKVDKGDVGELDKLVIKWEKWHKELEGIRRWFV